MSFAFNAVGTAAEVAEQLATVETDNVLGARLAETLAELMADPANLPAVAGTGEYRYVVKAYGHSGGSSAVHLKADVEALWVPSVPLLPFATAGTEYLARDLLEIGGEVIPRAGDGED